MPLRIFLLGVMAFVSIFLVNQIMKFFNRKRLDTVLKEDEPLAIREKKVIQLAAKSGGKITLPEICMKTNLSVDDAKETLDSLMEKEVLTIQMSDRGSKIYTLIDLATDSDKKNAIDLI